MAIWSLKKHHHSSLEEHMKLSGDKGSPLGGQKCAWLVVNIPDNKHLEQYAGPTVLQYTHQAGD